MQCAISTVAVAATAAAYYVISHRLKSTSSRRSLWDFVAEGGTNQKLLFILDLYQKDRQLKQTQPKFKDLISKIEDIEIAKDVSVSCQVSNPHNSQFLLLFQLSDDGWNIEVRVRSHIIDEIKITTSDKESPKMIDNVIYVTSVSFDGTSSSIDNGGKTSIAITNAIQRCLEQCIHDSLGE